MSTRRLSPLCARSSVLTRSVFSAVSLLEISVRSSIHTHVLAFSPIAGRTSANGFAVPPSSRGGFKHPRVQVHHSIEDAVSRALVVVGWLVGETSRRCCCCSSTRDDICQRQCRAADDDARARTTAWNLSYA
jgi:hypothetical protein